MDLVPVEAWGHHNSCLSRLHWNDHCHSGSLARADIELQYFGKGGRAACRADFKQTGLSNPNETRAIPLVVVESAC